MELFRIIRDYGEDRFAKNIAKECDLLERLKAFLEEGNFCLLYTSSMSKMRQKPPLPAPSVQHIFYIPDMPQMS